MSLSDDVSGWAMMPTLIPRMKEHLADNGHTDEGGVDIAITCYQDDIEVIPAKF